jgi:hypothetical protein
VELPTMIKEPSILGLKTAIELEADIALIGALL